MMPKVEPFMAYITKSFTSIQTANNFFLNQPISCDALTSASDATEKRS